MDNFEITKICNSDPLIAPMFIGVFPADLLPKSMEKNKVLVANLSDSSKPGSHWIVIYNTVKTLYYIDSFGKKPSSNDIVTAIESYNSTIEYNDKQLQHDLSNQCALWCIIFIYFISRDLTPQEIINQYFSSDLLYNELLVRNFSVQVFGLDRLPTLINVEKLIKNIYKNEVV